MHVGRKACGQKDGGIDGAGGGVRLGLGQDGSEIGSARATTGTAAWCMDRVMVSPIGAWWREGGGTS